MKPIPSNFPFVGHDPYGVRSLSLLCAGIILIGGSGAALAQTLPAGNPISATIPDTEFALTLEEVIQLPDSDTGNNRFARIEQISPAPDGSTQLYVSDQRGKVYTFTPGDASPTLFFDFGASIPNFWQGNQSGVRGFAFHPDILDSAKPGYRKMYTAQDISTAASGDHHGSSVSEWTLDSNGAVVSSSRREILYQSQPRGDHNIGKIGFNPNASPSDADYGNLYISFGDGGNYRSTSAGGSDTTLNPNGQDTTNFLGSILRINPLQSGEDPYTVPSTGPSANPFIGQAGIEPEIWAYGLRNPHQFSWDTAGSGMMLVADIGQSNIEEVNIGSAGVNYGWSIREGTFDMTGKAPDNPIAADVLPANHATDEYVYPVVQFDHDFDNAGQDGAAIAGGFVYRGTRIPLLQGKYVFGNFSFTAAHQDILVVDVDQLVLRDDFTNFTSFDNGFLAPLQKVRLLDMSGDPVTLLDLIRDKSGNSSQNRTDMRFGIDNAGELYVSSKKSGTIWRFMQTPKLEIVRSGPDQATLSWEPETPGWVLEESASLMSGDWDDAPSGSENPVVVPLADGTKFYRMHQP